MRFISAFAIFGFFFAVLFSMIAGFLIDTTCAATGFLCSPNQGIFAFIQIFNEIGLPYAFSLTAVFYMVLILFFFSSVPYFKYFKPFFFSIFCFSNIKHFSPVYEVKTSWLARLINSPGF